MGKILTKNTVKAPEDLKKIAKNRLKDIELSKLAKEKITVEYKVPNEYSYTVLLNSMTKKGFTLVERNGDTVVFSKKIEHQI